MAGRAVCRLLPAALVLLLAAGCGRPAGPPPPSAAPPTQTAAPASTATASSTAAPAPTLTVTPSPTPLPPTITPTAAPSPTPQVRTTRETRGPLTLVTAATIHRYMVDGRSADEIAARMRERGPRDALGGYTWQALTVPLFNWRPDCVCDETGCAAASLTVFLTLDTTLPLWEPPEGSDPALAAQWRAFETALAAHEQDHASLAAACAWQLADAFAALPPQPSCADLDAALRAASEEVFPACRAAQRAYDNETDHGRLQGVVWPP